MQLMPGTAKDMGVTDPFNPQQNVAGGTKYLQQLFEKYGNWREALAAYNWGPRNYDEAKAVGKPLPAETRAYVAKVMQQAGL
jgi:soluble lytic murein transglycosylase-like protein